jgi:predicted nucleic acid-binding protein
MIFVDTGYLVALIDRNDQHNARAVAWSAHVREELIATTAVVLETFNNLSATYLRPLPHLLFDSITKPGALTVAQIEPDLLPRGLLLHRQRPDKLWSLTDCISFVVMTDRGITRALAYDHHFEQAGFEALLRRDPS